MVQAGIRRVAVVIPFFALLAAPGCTRHWDNGAEIAAAQPTTGVVKVITYNVAGLPAPISASKPELYLPQIGPRLNGFDLVLIQESFWYHDLLATGLTLPHRSDPALASVTGLGDGLQTFARGAFQGFRRHAWKECFGAIVSGSDCLASKGFSVATHQLAPGVAVDVYNLHMDAGRGAGDRKARHEQVKQLLHAINTDSAGKAIILAGDTNMRGGDEEDLNTLMQQASLRDACRSLGVGEPDRIDRIMVRSSLDLELEPLRWYLDPDFMDKSGEPLSDHEPLVVDVRWKKMPPGGAHVSMR